MRGGLRPAQCALGWPPATLPCPVRGRHLSSSQVAAVTGCHEGLSMSPGTGRGLGKRLTVAAMTAAWPCMAQPQGPGAQPGLPISLPVPDPLVLHCEDRSSVRPLHFPLTHCRPSGGQGRSPGWAGLGVTREHTATGPAGAGAAGTPCGGPVASERRHRGPGSRAPLGPPQLLFVRGQSLGVAAFLDCPSGEALALGTIWVHVGDPAWQCCQTGPGKQAQLQEPSQAGCDQAAPRQVLVAGDRSLEQGSWGGRGQGLFLHQDASGKLSEESEKAAPVGTHKTGSSVTSHLPCVRHRACKMGQSVTVGRLRGGYPLGTYSLAPFQVVQLHLGQRGRSAGEPWS